MKITEIQKTKYQNRLDELKEKEPALNKQVEYARQLGDLSENSEYDSALADLSNNKSEQSRIWNILEIAEIVSYDQSSLITEGSMIEVITPSLPKSITLLVSDSGDAMLEGVLNTKSALGKAILGNTDGDYRVDNVTYSVRKIMKPDVENFVGMYPSDDKVLERFFNDRLE